LCLVKSFSATLALLLAISAVARGGDADWRAQISAAAPGGFPPLPSVRLEVRFGWSNVLEAAAAEATIKREGDVYTADVTGKTEGLARALWPLDARHQAKISASRLSAEHTRQSERYRKRSIDTEVKFDEHGVDRFRKTSDAGTPPKWKRFDFAPVFDVIGGVMFVRSQPLKVGDTVGLVCFPGDSPYVTVVRVEKRETIYCMGRDWPALRLSLGVRKLETKKNQPTEAVGYSKFRSGTVWVSDDELRLPLRAEVSVMIGFVYAELSGFKLL
jgi:hypothetical protein